VAGTNYVKGPHRLRLRGDTKLHIIPLGDVHVGSTAFNKDYFEYALDYIHEIQKKEPTIIYLMGDLLEAADKKVGDSVYNTDMSLDDQVEYIIDSLKPYRKRIRFTCIGNHEHRLKDTYNLDLMDIIANALKTEAGYSVVDRLKVGREEIRVHMHHGSGWSKYEHTALAKLQRETSHIQADIFLQGHNHRAGHYTQPYIHYGDELRVKRKHYFFTGTFMGHASYARAKALPYLPEAFMDIRVDKKGVVNSRMLSIDVEAPGLIMWG